MMSIRMRERERRRSESRLFIYFLVFCLALTLTNACISDELIQEKSDGKRTQVMSQLLEDQLKRGDGDARETARQLGISAGPILWQYFQSESEEHRALSLECLAEIGGEEATKVLVMGLDDPALDVRYTAVRLLHRVYSAVEVIKLREQVEKSGDEWVRGNVALILGKLEDTAATPIIKRQITVEKNERAVKQMTLALARLEDGEARLGLLKRLAEQDHRVRYEAIGDFEYLNKPELVNHLLPLLSDTREVKNVGAEPFPVFHRVCDRAVEAVAAIFTGRLPFVTGVQNYSDDEIEQARKIAQGL